MVCTKVSLITLPRIPDERGNISFLQNNEQVPFPIRRICWINDIPSGSRRDGQSSLNTTELIIALSGSFEIKVHDGLSEHHFMLNRPDICLLVPKKHWRQFENFATNSIVLILSDLPAGVDELITDFSTFICAS